MDSVSTVTTVLFNGIRYTKAQDFRWKLESYTKERLRIALFDNGLGVGITNRMSKKDMIDLAVAKAFPNELTLHSGPDDEKDDRKINLHDTAIKLMESIYLAPDDGPSVVEEVLDIAPPVLCVPVTVKMFVPMRWFDEVSTCKEAQDALGSSQLATLENDLVRELPTDVEAVQIAEIGAPEWRFNEDD